MHKELDRIHDNAFDAAWAALEASNDNFTTLGREKQYRDWQLEAGDTQGAAETQKEIKRLLKQTRFK